MKSKLQRRLQNNQDARTTKESYGHGVEGSKQRVCFTDGIAGRVGLPKSFKPRQLHPELQMADMEI